MIGMGGNPLLAFIDTPGQRYTPHCFTHALLLAALCALFFLCGAFCSEEISAILDMPITTRSVTPPTTSAYCFLLPALSRNNLLLCFVRNDGAPRLSMAECVIGSLANISLANTNYIFIYPLGMEMARKPPLRLQLLLHQYAHHVCPFYKENKPVSYYYKNTVVIKTRR